MRGRIATDRVVLTAGAWSRELAATAGLDLPVEPERRFMFFTDDAPAFPHELPLTIDFGTGFYFHREGAGLVFGGREQSLEEIAEVAVRRLPPLGDLGVRSSWWGLYEMSPDHNALVGATDDPTGLVYATGFSGHGFQQGPVIGEHLAQLALGLDPTFDLAELSVERSPRGHRDKSGTSCSPESVVVAGRAGRTLRLTRTGGPRARAWRRPGSPQARRRP